MTPKEQIEQAAQKHTELQATNIRREDCSYCTQDFKAGADYVLQHPELMKDFWLGLIEWVDRCVISEGEDCWKVVGDDPTEYCTTDELFTLYLEHLKQKQ
jgi:hypothetical protein